MRACIKPGKSKTPCFISSHSIHTGTLSLGHHFLGLADCFLMYNLSSCIWDQPGQTNPKIIVDQLKGCFHSRCCHMSAELLLWIEQGHRAMQMVGQILLVLTKGQLSPSSFFPCRKQTTPSIQLRDQSGWNSNSGLYLHLLWITCCTKGCICLCSTWVAVCVVLEPGTEGGCLHSPWTALWLHTHNCAAKKTPDGRGTLRTDWLKQVQWVSPLTDTTETVLQNCHRLLHCHLWMMLSSKQRKQGYLWGVAVISIFT